MKTLLPPNSTPLERNLEKVSDRLAAPAVDQLWDPALCPERFLPWLAFGVGVEEWDAAWPVETQRSVIATQIRINRHRGTVWAVRQAMIAAGYQDAWIEEGAPPLRRDGSFKRDGLEVREQTGRWAFFKVIADLGETVAVTSAERARLARLIESAKPVRSVLRGITYRSNVSDEQPQTESVAIQGSLGIKDVSSPGVARDGRIKRNRAASRAGQFDPLALKVNILLPDQQVATRPRRTGAITRGAGARHGAQVLHALEAVRLRAALEVQDTHDPQQEDMPLQVSASLVDRGSTAPRRCGEFRRNATIKRNPVSDLVAFTGYLVIEDMAEVSGRRDGSMRRDSAIRRGAGNRGQADGIRLVLTRFQERNGRVKRNGSTTHRHRLVSTTTA